MKNVYRSVLPSCDFHDDKPGTPAAYDAPTIHRGSWAFMCEEHWATEAHPNADAYGFRFVLRTEDPDEI